MELGEGIIIGLILLFISALGFMVSVVNELQKIRKEQEKITQYISFKFLRNR